MPRRRVAPPIDNLAVYPHAYVTAYRLAEYLGYSPHTVRLWCRTGMLPAGKPSNHDWRIPKDVALALEQRVFSRPETRV